MADAVRSAADIGSNKRIVERSPREKLCDVLFWFVRASVVINIIILFFPNFNAARITEKINKNMSLFTCGVSYKTLTTEFGRAFTRGWVPEAAFRLLNVSSLIVIFAVVIMIVGACMSLGNNKMKKTSTFFTIAGAVIEACALIGIYRSYDMLLGSEKLDKASPSFPAVF